MTCKNEIVAVSNVADGDMIFRDDTDNSLIIKNREIFLHNNNININDATLVKISYETDDFCKYFEVNNECKSKGMFASDIFTADALVTRSQNHALFLPLADCIGAAIFDHKNNILMLSHLGRHSLEQNGAYKSIRFLIEQYGCNPKILHTYLSPAAGKEKYPLHKFNGKSMKEIAYQQFIDVGIDTNNIFDNPADTTKDQTFFSHSEFLKGNRYDNGRHAIVAILN